MVIRPQEDINVAEHIVPINARRVSLTNTLLGSEVVYDTITATYPSTTIEVYAFRTGGVAGIIEATITVTYTDSSKDLITSAVRT